MSEDPQLVGLGDRRIGQLMNLTDDRPALLLDRVGVREGLDEHRALFDAVEPADARDLVAAAAAANIRGRGGAGFPTATKLMAVIAQGGTPRVVLNGAESEPASCKDRYLMRSRPHLILRGLDVCVRAIGATRAHLYVSDRESLISLEAAVADDPQPYGIQSHAASDRYVSGEETAVIRSINEGMALPTDKPPRPYQSGVRRHPTLVLNVETLAQLAMLGSPGMSAGTAAGSFLATVSGPGEEASIVELPHGISLPSLKRRVLGKGVPTSAVLMGGFFGGLLPIGEEVVLDFDALTRLDSCLGSTSIVFLNEDTECPVGAALIVARFFAEESAGQCGSCVRGTAAVRDALAALCRGEGQPGTEDSLRRWATVSLPGSGACALPDGLARLIRSLLRYFPSLISTHIGSACPACSAVAEAAPDDCPFTVHL